MVDSEIHSNNTITTQELAQRYVEHLERQPALSLPPQESAQALANVCFTANTGRAHLDYRLAVVAQTIGEAHDKLKSINRAINPIDNDRAPILQAPKVAFLFTGQGSQYVDMGKQLYQTQPTFSSVIERCDEILRPYLAHSLLDILYPKGMISDEASSLGEADELINRTAYAQPALFALEYALAMLWQSWGVKPDVVIGHSTGEYVAACVAGVLSLEDGLKLIAERGRLIESVSEGGATAAVLEGADRVSAAIAPYGDKITVAGMNSPWETLIAGPVEVVDTVLVALKEQGLDSRRLQIPHASHSPLMAPVLDEFEKLAQQVTYREPRVKLISNLTGGVLADTIDATYWRRHLREPVRFVAGMKQLEAEACNIMLEIGPAPVLQLLGQQNWRGPDQVWLASLWSIREDWEQLLQSAGTLYTHGVDIDWVRFDQDYSRRKVVLPTYPWQRQRYWMDKPSPRLGYQNNSNTHPLLGRRVKSAAFKNNEIQYESDLSATFPSYLTDHRVYEHAILPATAYLEMVLKAGTNLLKTDQLVIEQFAIHQALILPEETALIQVQVILTPTQADYTFQIYSAYASDDAENTTFRLHAEGIVRRRDASSSEVIDPESLGTSLTALQANITEVIDIEAFYQSCERGNLNYGPHFRLVKQLWRGHLNAKEEASEVSSWETPSPKALGLIRLPTDLAQAPESQGAATYKLHPALLDACLQVSGAFLLDLRNHDNEATYLPIGVARLDYVRQPGQEVWCEAQVSPEAYRGTEGGITSANEEILTFDLRLWNPDGQLVAKIDGLQVKQITYQALWVQLALSRKEAWRDWLYHSVWREAKHVLEGRANGTPSDVAVNETTEGDWLILADRTGVGRKLADLLNEHGMHTRLVYMNQTDEKLTADQYAINWTDPTDWEQLLADRSYRAVVYLWSLDDNENHSFTSSCGQVLHLVQALIKTNSRDVSVAPTTPPRLWLVTKGAQSVQKADMKEANPIAPWQTSLWGLGKVIDLEHPELRTVCLDLSPDSSLSELNPLLDELLTPDEESLIAYRNGVRHVARLERYRSSQVLPEGEMVRRDGSYLITGGLGGLGVKVAQWLIEKGAQHLVLTGRSGANQTAKKVINQLEQAGAKISVIKADVTSVEDVKKVLSASPKLRGVVHAAGVLDDGILIQLSLARFEKVMAPKVQGAWNLHQLTQNMPLDFFVLFSSAASLLGSLGQGNYAAANAFMDGLADYRRSLGLPALSINWGAWADIGMTSGLDKKRLKTLEDLGMKMIAPEPGLQVLGELLKDAKHVTQVGVFPVHWSKYMPHKISPFFSIFAPAFSQTARQSEDSDMVEILSAVPVNEQRELLMEHLRATIRQVMGGEMKIEPHERLFDLGLDSLMALEVKNHLESNLKQPLRSTLLFNYPTLSKLADYLAQEVLSLPRLALELAVQAPDVNGQDMTASDKDEANFDQSSTDEFLALLDKKLSKIEKMR